MGSYCGAFNQRLLKVNIQGKVILLELSFRKSNVMAAALEGLELKTPETEDGARMRFQVELEFVQCLANPHYLNFLAQRGYFKEQSFINYLKYLLYWKKPEYAKFLKYPQCLHFLELLQYEHFRRELVNPACAKFIDEQQILHWQYYSRRRMRMNLPKTGQTGPGTEAEQSGR